MTNAVIVGFLRCGCLSTVQSDDILTGGGVKNHRDLLPEVQCHNPAGNSRSSSARRGKKKYSNAGKVRRKRNLRGDGVNTGPRWHKSRAECTVPLTLCCLCPHTISCYLHVPSEDVFACGTWLGRVHWKNMQSFVPRCSTREPLNAQRPQRIVQSADNPHMFPDS